MLARSSNALGRKRRSTKFTQDERARYILLPLQTPRSSGVGQPLNFYPSASLNFLSLAASAPLRLAKIEGASLEYLGSLKWNQYIHPVMKNHKPKNLRFFWRWNCGSSSL